MGTSSGSEFNHQQSPQMLQTSLSLVSANILQEQFRDSPSESASSRETADDKLYMENKQLRHISNSDKMSLRDVARERVDLISESMQHLPDEFLEKLKIELRVMLEGSGGSMHRDEFLFLQKLVQSRTDLTYKTLIGAHRIQLEILVTIKSGIQAFLHPTVTLSQASLSELFLYKRCRNIACGSPLPAEDCNCEPCAMTNGFCNLCMCVICNKFDFEVNTCRWIGCDQCSLWTHTDCAIRNRLIGTGLGVKTGSAPLDMYFRCKACNRTSELMGWVKDVFKHCAPSWDREALIRELDFVSRIFRGSEDPRGRKLFWKCEELIDKLKGGMVETMACKVILMFFQEFDVDPSKNPDINEVGRLIAPQEAFNKIGDVVQETIRKMEIVAEEKMRMVKKARLSVEACDQELKDKSCEVSSLKMERCNDSKK